MLQPLGFRNGLSLNANGSKIQEGEIIGPDQARLFLCYCFSFVQIYSLFFLVCGKKNSNNWSVPNHFP